MVAIICGLCGLKVIYEYMLTLRWHKLADFGQIRLQVSALARLQLDFQGVQGMDGALRSSPGHSSSDHITGWLCIDLDV